MSAPISDARFQNQNHLWLCACADCAGRRRAHPHLRSPPLLHLSRMFSRHALQPRDAWHAPATTTYPDTHACLKRVPAPQRKGQGSAGAVGAKRKVWSSSRVLVSPAQSPSHEPLSCRCAHYCRRLLVARRRAATRTNRSGRRCCQLAATVTGRSPARDSAAKANTRAAGTKVGRTGLLV